MVKRLVSVDNDTLQFPDSVRAVHAENLNNPNSVEGAAIGAGRNVKHYGAVGNGIEDDTAAIEAAVAAAGGERVYLPAGDYVASLSFTNEDVHLTGPGRIIQGPGASAIRVERTPDTGRTVTAIGTIRLGAVNTFGTEVCSALTLAQSDMHDLRAGDACILASQDFYADDLLLTGTSKKTYMSSWVPVAGFALVLGTITNGGVAVGDTITASGGASGVAQGVATDGSAVTVVLDKFAGTFANGQTVSVGGTSRGTITATPVLVMNGRLRDAHATSPLLHKMPRGKCRIEVNVAASGNPNDIIPSGDRTIAVDLRGVIDPQIHMRIESAWSRAVTLSSCLGGSVDVEVTGGLPDQTGTAGYGYGVELWGATEGTSVRVIGRNLRHAFTTNVLALDDFASSSLLRRGVPKDWRVHDSIAWAPSAAGFDTHHGSYDGTFDNCVVYGTRSAGRALSSSVGFNNRGWRTVFRNCDAYDCVDGFSEQVGSVTSHLDGKVRYIGCNAYRYQRYGFGQAGLTALDTDSVIDYRDCYAEADGSPTNDPFFQTGFSARLGYNIRYTRCETGICNGAPFRVEGAARVVARDCHSDLAGSIVVSAAWRFDSAPTEASLLGFTYRVDPAATSNPNNVIRVNTAAVTLTCDGVRSTSSTVRPLSTLTSGGTLTLNTPVESGRELYGSATWDPASLNQGDTASTTVTVSGAAVGDLVEAVSFSAGTSGCIITAQVTATDTVTVWLQNLTGVTRDVASGTVRVLARRRPA